MTWLLWMRGFHTVRCISPVGVGELEEEAKNSEHCVHACLCYGNNSRLVAAISLLICLFISVAAAGDAATYS